MKNDLVKRQNILIELDAFLRFAQQNNITDPKLACCFEAAYIKLLEKQPNQTQVFEILLSNLKTISPKSTANLIKEIEKTLEKANKEVEEKITLKLR